MGVLSFFRQVYDLDTIDTRFTTPSTASYKPGAAAAPVDSRTDPDASKDRAAKWNSRPPPSRWNTPEFYLYYLVFLVAIPSMIWIGYDASRSEHPSYKKYEHHLSEGWIPGRKIDVSDAQYHTFRSNLPYMAFFMLMQPTGRRVYEFVRGAAARRQGPRPAYEEAETRLSLRASFDFAFSIKFMFVLHGISAFKIFAILWLNYKIATALPRRYVPLATWIFNIGILFANEIYEGYKFEHIAAFVSGRPAAAKALADSGTSLVDWGKWLDGHAGLMGRWEVLFNLTILRMISFNLDYYWSTQKRSTNAIEKQLDPATLSERDRVSIPAQPKDYSYRNFMSYIMYAPLYLTGPILTFNDYISQLRYKSASIELGRTIRYGIRFLLALLTMEVMLHYVYVQAIAHANPDWTLFTPAQLSLLSYFNLHAIWLKLLLPWRLFRLWALIDGIDPPENMIRCVSDNYSALSFWRSWHRSFYRWSLRYIYLPLGGSSFRDARSAGRSVLTYALVFTFVALWHDIQMRLLIWGWLVVLFMLPEMAAGLLFPKRKWEARPTAYRMISGVGGVANVLMMMMANLVGFAFGLDGLELILAGIFKDFSGIAFITAACLALFVGIQVMFEVRESEMRKGVNLKC